MALPASSEPSVVTFLRGGLDLEVCLILVEELAPLWQGAIEGIKAPVMVASLQTPESEVAEPMAEGGENANGGKADVAVGRTGG
ncbi:hypothetical protein HOY80DRAFT_1026906 [Tuber brumale]|nr:hypothetical protein HOY80DRAFT_1026906 [Tuber brumale]